MSKRPFTYSRDQVDIFSITLRLNRKICMINTSARKSLLVVFIFSVLLTSIANAGGLFDRWHHRGGDIITPFERMIDHLDLTEFQQEQAEVILKNARKNTDNLHSMKRIFIKKIVNNNPDSIDYFDIAEQQADEMTNALKSKIILFAKVRHDIYQILTPEQKVELEKHIAKCIKRMES